MTIVLLVIGAVVACAGFFWRKSAAAKLNCQAESAEDGKKKKKGLVLPTLVTAAGMWLFVVKLLELIFGAKARGSFEVDIWAERVDIAGVSISATVLTSWVIMAVILIFALLVRIFVIPKMTDKPKGLQNVLELCVETICSYSKSGAGRDMGEGLPAYLFSLVLFRITMHSDIFRR